MKLSRKTLFYIVALGHLFATTLPVQGSVDEGVKNVKTINQTYTSEYCHQLELAYGEGMMSEKEDSFIGGLFQGINLYGKRLLDFGSGLGGVATYLASKHQATVAGVEINAPMIEAARRKVPENLRQQVSFHLAPPEGTLPFSDESFDVIYSKGVIVHLNQAQRMKAFQEFHRLLKKGGKLVIHDWLSPIDDQWSPTVQDLIETESLPLFAYAPQTYDQHLQESGFSNVTLEDRSAEYSGYNENIVTRLNSEKIKGEFIGKYGEETFKEHVRGYQNIVSAYQSKEALGMLITATKD